LEENGSGRNVNYKIYTCSRALWHKLLGRWRQEDQEFEASLASKLVRLSQKTNKNKMAGGITKVMLACMCEALGSNLQYCKKRKKRKWTGGVTQDVEHWLCKHKALSSKFSPTKKKKMEWRTKGPWHLKKKITKKEIYTDLNLIYTHTHL
jgi:hypothetical protein